MGRRGRVTVGWLEAHAASSQNFKCDVAVQNLSRGSGTLVAQVSILSKLGCPCDESTMLQL